MTTFSQQVYKIQMILEPVTSLTYFFLAFCVHFLIPHVRVRHIGKLRFQSWRDE